jgi:Ca-activated chloride channel homolog
MRGAFLSTLLCLCACSAAAPTPPVVHPEPPRTVAVAAKPQVVVPVTHDVGTPPAKPKHLVHLETARSNAFVGTAKDQEVVVRVRVTADHIDNAKRPPINLALVIDTSGSMAGESIERARAASIELLGRLSKGDVISVVTFGSTAEVLVPSTVLGDDITPIRSKIEEMSANGTTDMAGGLAAGLVQVREHFDPKGINRIVFVGDGVPNDPAPIMPQVQSAAQQGISITTLGLGIEYDETLLGQIAQQSGGSFHFVEDPAKLAGVFDGEVLRLKHMVANGSTLTLTPGPGVVLDGVLGLAAARSGRSLVVQVGNLAEGESRDVFVRVRVGEHPAGVTVELLDAALQYADAVGEGAALNERAFVAASASSDKDEVAKGRDADIEHAALRLRVADLTVRAIASARGGDLLGARRLCDEAIKLAQKAAKDFSDTELAAKEKELKKLRGTLAQLVPPPQTPWQPDDGRLGLGRGAAAAPAMKPAAARALRAMHGEAMDAFSAQ